MAAEHRGSASVAVVPGSGLSSMPAEIQELGRNVGAAGLAVRRQMPPGVRGSDKRCEKTERLLSVPSCRKRGQIQNFYQAVQQPDKTGLRSQRELERHLPSPVP